MKGTVQERFEAKYTKSDGCWNWHACEDGKGYGQIRIAGRNQQAHRVAYQLYVGEIPAGMCVCHRCDNPGCVNPDHLFLGTIADNRYDCEIKGRGNHPSGEKHPFAKLSNEQADEVRRMRSEGARVVDIAKEFNVRPLLISKIVCGHTFRTPDGM